MTLWWAVALAALLRLPFIGRFGLWLDEAYVHDDALAPLSESLSSLHFFHFLVVKPFLAIRDNEFFLRLPSALLGILAVPLGFLSARRLMNERAGIVFAVFLAAAPFLVNYSLDANYYSHMVFWVLAAMYFWSRLHSTRRLWNLAPLAAIPIVCFYVHPFSALFFVPLALVTLASLLSPPAGAAEAASQSSRPGSIARRVALLSAVACLAGLIGCLFRASLMRLPIFQSATGLLDVISFGSSPPNVLFSFGFFYDCFRRIGPAYYFARPWGAIGEALAVAGTWLLFALFVAGCIGAWRKSRLLALLLFLPFALSFLFIFNIATHHFFDIRYFAYLVPLYWMSIAGAIVRAGELSSRSLPMDKRQARAHWTVRLLAGMCLLSCAPQLWFVASQDGRSWNAVMPVVAKEAAPGDPLVYMNWAEDALLSFYKRKNHMEARRWIRLEDAAERSPFAESQLKHYCWANPAVWVLSSWMNLSSPEALDWARTRMEKRAYGGSLLGPKNAVALYRWSSGGRYVWPPRILRYRALGEKAAPAARFDETFLFDQTQAYEWSVKGTGEAGAEDLETRLDGQPLALKAQSNAEGGWVLSGRSDRIDSGEHALDIASRRGLFQIHAIEVIPRWPDNRVEIPVSSAFSIYPSDVVSMPRIEKDFVVRMNQNALADYGFGLAEGGLYRLSCEAKNDKAGPILLEIRLDDRAAGILAFSRRDDSWEEMAFPTPISAADHVLTIRFLNESALDEAGAKAQRTAQARRLSLRPLGPSEESVDQRLLAPAASPRRVSFAERGWSVAGGKPEARFGLDKDSLPGELAFTASLSPQSGQLTLESPPQEIKSSGIVYYSALVRCRNLQNHWANLVTFFMDKTGGRVRKQFVNPALITKTTDWVRLVEFESAPPGAVQYKAQFVVYPRDKRPFREDAQVSFAGLQIEAE